MVTVIFSCRFHTLLRLLLPYDVKDSFQHLSCSTHLCRVFNEAVGAFFACSLQLIIATTAYVGYGFSGGFSLFESGTSWRSSGYVRQDVGTIRQLRSSRGPAQMPIYCFPSICPTIHRSSRILTSKVNQPKSTVEATGHAISGQEIISCQLVEG